MNKNHRFLALTAALVAVGAALFAACSESKKGEPPRMPTRAAADAPAEDPVERGEYLVATHACNDCHTPFKTGENGPEPDMTRMLSGQPQDEKLPPPPKPAGPWIWSGSGTMTAFAGPWGISYAANLTPDEDTGIGAWTEDIFIQALKTGKHMGAGRPIMPPMPWQWFSEMTVEDLKAIYAYLRTIPPIKNEVPEYQPPSEMKAAKAPK